MKWFAVNQRPFVDETERFLYAGTALRMLAFVGKGPNGEDCCVTFSFRPDLEQEEWSAELSAEQLENVIKRACLKLPGQEQRIREQARKEYPSHLPLQLTRVGPACPEIFAFPGTYVVRENVFRQLDGAGPVFLAIRNVKVLPLYWELGEPVPDALRATKPPEYISLHSHSPVVAGEIGKLYEMRVPETHWYPAHLIATTKTDWQRFSFGVKEDMLSGDGESKTRSVELAFENKNDVSWIRLRPSDNSHVVYEFVREDVLEIIHTAARWTLEFVEVDYD